MWVLVKIEFILHTVMALFFTHVPSPSTSFLHCTDLHSLLVYSFPLTSSTTILCHTTEVYLCLDSQQQQLVAPIPGIFIYPNYTGQISAVLGGSSPFNIMQAPHSGHPSLLRFPSPRLAWYTASQLLVLRQAECPCNSTVFCFKEYCKLYNALLFILFEAFIYFTIFKIRLSYHLYFYLSVHTAVSVKSS
jgi:hypothetical protein